MENNNNITNSRRGIRLLQRKKRVKITPDILKKIETRTDRGDSAMAIADALELSVATIGKWQRIMYSKNTLDECFSLLKKSGPRSTNRDKIIKVAEAVQSDNSLTQKGIAVTLERLGHQGSQSSVSLILKSLDITRKRLKRRSEVVLSPRIIGDRRSFSIRYRASINSELLFLDETGFNLHTRPQYGYSPKNVPAYATVINNRGRNVSLLALISNRGILKYKIIEGAFNSVLLLDFLQECVTSNVFTSKTLIMDNVRFHKTESVLSFFSEKNISYDFLPPYSPQLNPIEEVFSVIKNRFYNLRPYPDSVDSLINNIERSIESVNNDVNFNAFYEHMRHYFDLSFNGNSFN